MPREFVDSDTPLTGAMLVVGLEQRRNARHPTCNVYEEEQPLEEYVHCFRQCLDGGRRHMVALSWTRNLSCSQR